jgi:hypothetical protein
MAGLLDRIRSELHARLEELRPLVGEQRRLEAALHALGDSAPTEPAASSAKRLSPTNSRARKPAPRQPRKRAPRGANRAAALRAVREHRGATSAELASASGVGRNTLYALLARLVKDGVLQTSKLPSARTGYTLSGPPADA